MNDPQNDLQDAPRGDGDQTAGEETVGEQNGGRIEEILPEAEDAQPAESVDQAEAEPGPAQAVDLPETAEPDPAEPDPAQDADAVRNTGPEEAVAADPGFAAGPAPTVALEADAPVAGLHSSMFHETFPQQPAFAPAAGRQPGGGSFPAAPGYADAPPDRRPRITTIVWGLILALLGAGIMTSQLTDLGIEPGVAAIGFVGLAGLLLIVGAVISAVRK